MGHGLYRKAEAPPADLDRIEIALRASDATLYLTTALSHHDLADLIPSEIDVALPRSRRPPRVRAPVRWHRFRKHTFDVGRATIEVDDGLSIGIYSAERSLIDAFRLRLSPTRGKAECEGRLRARSRVVFVGAELPSLAML